MATENQNEIEIKVLDLFRTAVYFNGENSTLETKLVDDLHLDEIDRSDLAIDLEDIFNISIDDTEIDKCVTVQDVCNFIKTALG